MHLFQPLELAIVFRYVKSNSHHRFASFIGLLATVGIAIGVCALIVVSSMMQGLQDKLKQAVLNDTPQVIVAASESEIYQLLRIPHVIAASLYLDGQVLMQTSNGVELLSLQGIDVNDIKVRKGYNSDMLHLPTVPEEKSYALNAEAALYLKYNLHIGNQVRLISMQNAKYSPIGLTPNQRVFTLSYYTPSLKSTTNTYKAIGNFSDITKFLRASRDDYSVRLWLDDPFKVDETGQALTRSGYNFTDWRDTQGAFFRAVALEKLSMTLMLFLIIIVATFNILSSLTMIVSTRLREIAILKTLGTRSSSILFIFTVIGMSCSVVGSLAGVVFGVPMAILSSDILRMFGFSLSNSANIPVTISVLNIVAVVLGCLVLSFLCTLYPAIKAASTKPVDHLAQN